MSRNGKLEHMPEKPGSVSVVVLAYNEAGNLTATIESIKGVLEDKSFTYEMVIVDDGSTDGTGELAEKLAGLDSHLRVVHNPGNRGCAYSYLTGAHAARYEYAWLVPGDGEISAGSLRAIADKIGTVDMVIPYPMNSNIRPLSRRIVSRGYTTIVNIAFGKWLKYYNGPCVIRSDLVRSTPTVQTRGFAFMAPLLLRLMRRKYTYVQVGIVLKPRAYGKPSINSIWNIFSALRTLMWLFWDMNIAEPLRGKRQSVPASVQSVELPSSEKKPAERSSI